MALVMQSAASMAMNRRAQREHQKELRDRQSSDDMSSFTKETSPRTLTTSLSMTASHSKEDAKSQAHKELLDSLLSVKVMKSQRESILSDFKSTQLQCISDLIAGNLKSHRSFP